MISNNGNIKSIDRKVITSNGPRFYKGKILKSNLSGDGYLNVRLSNLGVSRMHRIHVLVAFEFLPPCPGKYGRGKDCYIIDYIDGCKTNNNVSNLQWLLFWDNIHTKPKSKGKRLYAYGEKAVTSKLTNEQVLEIRSSNLTTRKLGEIYGVHNSTIHHIKLNHTWNHVK